MDTRILESTKKEYMYMQGWVYTSPEVETGPPPGAGIKKGEKPSRRQLGKTFKGRAAGENKKK
jgi:hypothetical protein